MKNLPYSWHLQHDGHQQAGDLVGEKQHQRQRGVVQLFNSYCCCASKSMRRASALCSFQNGRRESGGREERMGAAEHFHQNDDYTKWSASQRDLIVIGKEEDMKPQGDRVGSQKHTPSPPTSIPTSMPTSMPTFIPPSLESSPFLPPTLVHPPKAPSPWGWAQQWR